MLVVGRGGGGEMESMCEGKFCGGVWERVTMPCRGEMGKSPTPSMVGEIGSMCEGFCGGVWERVAKHERQASSSESSSDIRAALCKWWSGVAGELGTC